MCRIASKMSAGSCPGKGGVARGHLVQHHAEAEQVRPRVDFFRPRLLRRHVGHRPHRRRPDWSDAPLAAVRWASPRLPSFRRPLGLRSQFRQPKVQNLRLATLGHENVRWLDVPMDYALRVGSVQRVGNLDRQVQQFVRLQRLAGKALLQGLPSSNSMAMKGWPSCSPIS